MQGSEGTVTTSLLKVPHYSPAAGEEVPAKKCKYAQGSHCCVEAHVKRLLDDVDSEEQCNITWGRLIGARANDYPPSPNIRNTFFYAVESLAYRASRGELN